MSRQRIRFTGVALLMAVVVAACSGAAGGSGPSAESTATAPPSPASATPTPEPTATPVPIETLFKQKLASAWSVSGTITGRVSADSQDVPLHGTFTIDGRNSRFTLVLGASTQATTVDEVVVDGHTYARSGKSPWIEQASGTTPSAAKPPQMSTLLTRLDSLQADGTVTRDGRTLTRLLLPLGPEDAASLGLVPSGARVSQLTLAFYAEPDGTFAGLSVSASYTVSNLTPPSEVSMELELLATASPAVTPVTRPDEVWVVVGPSRAPYSFAIPEDWETKKMKGGVFAGGPDASSIAIFSQPVPRKLTVNQWTSGSLATLKRAGLKVTSTQKTNIAGNRGLLILYKYTVDGVAVTGVNASFLAAGNGYDIVCESASMNAAAERQFCDQFLATFTIRGGNVSTNAEAPQGASVA
jgi:hypothetical protein